MRLTNEQCWGRLRGADHAVLCTSNAARAIDAVPVCFTAVGKVLASPVDRVKPKETTDLARLRNLDRDNAATLLCEHWDYDDWSQLWWVRAQLVRRSGHDVRRQLLEECESALREKYPQYRQTEFAEVIVFDVKNLVGWSAASESQPEGTDPLR